MSKKTKLCKKCESEMGLSGYCLDDTCPYSDWSQEVDLSDLHEMSTEEAEKKYGIKKRPVSNSWDETVKAQGWDEYTEIIHLRAFIQDLGLERDLDNYAQDVSDEENLHSLSAV